MGDAQQYSQGAAGALGRMRGDPCMPGVLFLPLLKAPLPPRPQHCTHTTKYTKRLIHVLSNPL